MKPLYSIVAFIAIVSIIITTLAFGAVQGYHRSILPTNILIAPWDPEGGWDQPDPPVPVVVTYLPNPILENLLAPWEPEGGYKSTGLPKYRIV